MRAFIAIFACCFLLGCSELGSEQSNRADPPELEELRHMAFRCSIDAAATHVERSEHCVIVAENMFEANREDCEKKRTFDCMNYQAMLSEIYMLYQGAIAESLFEHGKSPEIEALAKSKWWRMIYNDGETMRGLYEQCLRSETEALAQNGLVKVTEILPSTLANGQMCFRKGYPEFTTKAIS